MLGSYNIGGRLSLAYWPLAPTLLEEVPMKKLWLLLFCAVVLVGCSHSPPAPFTDGQEITYEFNASDKPELLTLKWSKVGDGFRVNMDFKGAKKSKDKMKALSMECDYAGYQGDGYLRIFFPPTPIWAPPSKIAAEKEIYVELEDELMEFRFDGIKEHEGRKVAFYLCHLPMGKARAWFDPKTGYMLGGGITSMGTAILVKAKSTTIPELKDLL